MIYQTTDEDRARLNDEAFAQRMANDHFRDCVEAGCLAAWNDHLVALLADPIGFDSEEAKWTWHVDAPDDPLILAAGLEAVAKGIREHVAKGAA